MSFAYRRMTGKCDRAAWRTEVGLRVSFAG